MTGVLGAIPAGSRILLDTSVLVAYLGATEPVATAATDLIEGCLRTGRNDGVISTISVAELLTRPFRTDRQAVDMTVAFLWSLPDLLVPIRRLPCRRGGRPNQGSDAAGHAGRIDPGDRGAHDGPGAGDQRSSISPRRGASRSRPIIDVLLLADVIG